MVAELTAVQADNMRLRDIIVVKNTTIGILHKKIDKLCAELAAVKAERDKLREKPRNTRPKKPGAEEQAMTNYHQKKSETMGEDKSEMGICDDCETVAVVEYEELRAELAEVREYRDSYKEHIDQAVRNIKKIKAKLATVKAELAETQKDRNYWRDKAKGNG